MSRTFVRQETQILASDTYDDTIAATEADLETNPTHIEDDLNGLRSQINKIIDNSDWWAALTGRSLAGLETDLSDIEDKPLLFRTQVLTDVSVTAAQNWEVLSVAGSETPSETAAVGAVSTTGAVVAQNTSFGAHDLAEVAGPSALRPKNLVVVRLASNSEPIQTSNGKDVWGLLQSEIATDGHTFNDVDQRVQISFVRENATGDDLEACPVADIAGKTINYSYVRRIDFDNVPETAFLSGVFVDQAAGSADVTLNNAIDNQVGTATQTQDIDWDIADTNELAFTADSGATDLLKISPTVGGNTLALNFTDIDIDSTNDIDINNAIKVDTGGTEIDIGVTAGTIESTSTDDLRILGAGELYLDDGNQTGSTWAQTNGVKLSETTAEWDAYETEFGGEVSLLNAIVQASNKTPRTKAVAVVTVASIAKDANVTGAGGSPNIDAQLLDYSGVTFVDDVDIFLNGVLLRCGADAAANHDVYPGTTPANGDLKFEFVVKINDVITMVVNGQ